MCDTINNLKPEVPESNIRKRTAYLTKKKYIYIYIYLFIYVLLTVHPNIMIFYFFYQLDAQILYFNTFITFLYMFRALLCLSLGGQIVLYSI